MIKLVTMSLKKHTHILYLTMPFCFERKALEAHQSARLTTPLLFGLNLFFNPVETCPADFHRFVYFFV
ncbi:hypothetical protein ACNPHK_27625, partial [Klebsiella pneumoniae]